MDTQKNRDFFGNSSSAVPKKISNNEFRVERSGAMRVPLTIYASERLLKKIEEDGAIQQGMNVASLPGIVKHSIMMPDVHLGYGASVGGVAAFLAEDGVISPGMTGFDINCGVRLLRTNLSRKEVESKIKELLEELFRVVPVGLGPRSIVRLSNNDLDEILNSGVDWAIKKGYGNKEDKKFCEEEGRMSDADSSCISKTAKQRGIKQLGTLGAGNHFLEVQFVESIFDEKTSKAFGILEVGQVVIMIHTGSRGLGHQTCSDYLREIERGFPEIVHKLPDRDLAYAPANSKIAQDYYKGMCAAANFAFTNRHIIGHFVRMAFKKIFDDRIEVNTVYDIAHNMAKLEEHGVDGKRIRLFVHRKGATRAFGPGREEIPLEYRKFGQPVLIPGSMGTYSYVLVGTGGAMEKTFGSTAHGAGRVMSRHEAIRTLSSEKIIKDLEKNRIYIKAGSKKGIVEEAPAAYKDVDEVVKVSHEVGIGNIVCRLRPIGVIKG